MSRVTGGNGHVRSPLKWLGGKFTLLDTIIPVLCRPGGVESSGRFVEPFVGAGTVALNVPFDRLLVADANPDLPNFYTVVRSYPAAFDAEVAALFVPANNTLAAYLALRVEFNSMVGSFDPQVGDVRRAALFAYLNRHCFNGLCRYNLAGGFNAHFGSYKAPVWNHDAATALRTRLASATVLWADWRTTMERVEPGDTVYCDPPYLDTFSHYSVGGFGVGEHQDLAKAAFAAADRGARVVMSNSLEAASLYAGAEIVELDAVRSVSRSAAGRGKKTELLAVFDPVGR